MSHFVSLGLRSHGWGTLNCLCPETHYLPIHPHASCIWTHTNVLKLSNAWPIRAMYSRTHAQSPPMPTWHQSGFALPCVALNLHVVSKIGACWRSSAFPLSWLCHGFCLRWQVVSDSTSQSSRSNDWQRVGGLVGGGATGAVPAKPLSLNKAGCNCALNRCKAHL